MSGLWSYLKDNLDAVAQLITVASVIPGIWIFLWNQSKERRKREEADKEARRDRADAEQARADSTYRGGADRWVDFLNLAIQYPDYRLVEFDDDLFPSDLREDDARLDACFHFATNMFETAYRHYCERTTAREKQWKGWEQFIILYCTRPDYYAWRQRRIVKNGSADKGFSGYDEDFEEFIQPYITRALPQRIARTP